MPITSHSHVNPTWDSDPPNTSTWGVKYNQKAAQGPEPASKPPLPVSSFFLNATSHINVGLMALYFQPRPPNQTPDQPVPPESKTPSSRLSATTIDVPLFLQPIAYDPACAPPLPGLGHPIPQHVQTTILSPPEPERLPPPPPQKIPLGHVDIPQALKFLPQRPWHDPQHSYDDRQQREAPSSQRPRFDPQSSHLAGNRPYQWQSCEQRPTIPVPQFTSFDVKSALPLPEPQPKLSLFQKHTLPQSIAAAQSVDFSRSESPNKSTISLVDPSAAATSIPWESQAAYIPSPEQQHAALSPPDAQSLSTTDLSINTVGVSTPSSHQTSNTSYRENENRERIEQQGDDSFYWHSGRSSSEAEEDQGQGGSPTATPGGDSVVQRGSATTSVGCQHERQDLPIRSTSLSPTASATYGASALGFGGPSDWEYFGDYEAEEIDDEELYSRPRPRDLKSVVEGSTELPVDSPLDSIQPRNNESDLPNSESIRFGNPHLHGTSLSTSLGEKSSHECLVQDLIVQGEGEIETDAKPPAHGPVTPHATSGQGLSSPDTHSQQRPDLDDVMRAWSEAPYVGKVHEEAPVATVRPDRDEEAASIAEASLASTPRERMLGVDVILKGAPTLPKLPGSADSLSLDEHERELQRDANMSTTPQSAVTTATICERQMQPLSNRQRPATKDTLANAEVRPRKGENYTSESENNMQILLPSVDVVIPSGPLLSIHTESPINKIALDLDPPRDRYTDTRTHGLPQAPGEKMQIVSNENCHHSSPKVDLASDQQIVGNTIQENLQSENQENCKKNSEDAKSELSQILEGNTSHESIIMDSSKTIESLLREKSPSRDLIAFPERAQEAPSSFIPCNTFEENLSAKDNIKPRENHSQEDVKTQSTHSTGESSPLRNNAIDAPAQANTPPLTSDTSLPHYTTSMDMVTIQDPYSDLDPWGKASLNRFAAMLREESHAETNQDKLNIFNVFTSRESRLRVVLYGTDDELIIPQKMVRQKLETRKRSEKGGFVKQAIERANSIGLEPSLKALPALPANRESVIGLLSNIPTPSVIQHGSTRKGRGVVDLKVQSSEDVSRLNKDGQMPSGPSGDESYVMVEPPSDDVQYSPGGRPVVTRLRKTDVGTGVGSSQDARSSFEKDSSASSETPGSSRPADSPDSNGPISGGLEDSGAARKPAYTSLKFNDGRSEVKNYLANRKSVCRPYATLTQGSLESASTFGKERDVRLEGAASIITAPTSQYTSLSQATVDESSDTNKETTPKGEGPTDLRRFVKADFDPLLLALPESDAVVHVSARILDLRNVMEAVPDDFGFIHQSVVAWDTKTKRQREDNDRQRHARQAESEQKIDSLFDDHEIGYGDIAELEIEFKRSEAAKKADEDRFEYQTFVSDVFDLVWTRLNYELDQLIPHYDQYSKMMDHTLAGKDMFEGSKEGLALGPTMSSFLALHQKLEIRHQKAFEAVLERDRRLKKTEISPWYTLSNIAKVKQLEKQFEEAEKKAIIEYCLQRDARANHLMDVLDQNTLRGVGANQDYMEAIMKAVRRIASGRAFASVPGTNEPTAGLEEVGKAKAITALLASSSEQIVQTFHVADMLLNSADYEVSVAKAKVAKADMATLAKLKEERAKEDQKLMRDLEHRLALIREDTRRTNDEIVKLMLFLGVENGCADGVPAQAQAIDPKHKARIQKALEEAKIRNASKE